MTRTKKIAKRTSRTVSKGSKGSTVATVSKKTVTVFTRQPPTGTGKVVYFMVPNPVRTPDGKTMVPQHLERDGKLFRLNVYIQTEIERHGKLSLEKLNIFANKVSKELKPNNPLPRLPVPISDLNGYSHHFGFQFQTIKGFLFKKGDVVSST